MNNDKIKRDFVEVHDDFIDNDIIHIDAFTTADRSIKLKQTYTSS